MRNPGTVAPLSLAWTGGTGKIGVVALAAGGLPLLAFVICFYVAAVSGDRLPRG